VNIFRLGSTLDTSALPRSTAFTEVVARITGDDPIQSYYARANPAFGPDSPIGRTWAVNLCAWQAPSATPPQTNAPRNQLSLVSSLAEILIQADGASERILVDYPCSGTSFCVAGQSVEVTLLGTTNDARFVSPILGGYVAPAAGVTGVGDGPGRCATLTPASQSFAVGGAVLRVFDIPVRARGFVPLFHSATGSASLGFSILQNTGNAGPGTVINLCENLVTLPDGASGTTPGVIPLHPLAQTVSVTLLGGTPGDTCTVTLMWILQTCQ